MQNQLLKNKFNFTELSASMADLGTTIPLAFALVVYNHFPPERLFFLWGAVYLVTGWVFRVPVSVQPLKAMAAIAIVSGFTFSQLATAGFYYGVLLLVLSLTGTIKWLQKWFSPALIRGVQLGIGLILFAKAINLSFANGLFLGMNSKNPWYNFLILSTALILLGYFQFRKKKQIAPVLIIASILIAIVAGVAAKNISSSGGIVDFAKPDTAFLYVALVYLIIPQLPLTLGNAIFAANDACHCYWQDGSTRVNPTRLGLSIGLSNVLIGLLGGFPVCHGAGGIAAHAKFGGKTGGTTMIIGGIFIFIALFQPLTHFLFYIPVPLLGGMLIFASWNMIKLVTLLEKKTEIGIAIVVGGISFFTRNLSIALLAGFLVERIVIRNYKALMRKRKIETADCAEVTD